jgi:hypothetical protein
MSSSTSTTRRIRRAIFAAAATAGLGVFAVMGASSAFAQNGPPTGAQVPVAISVATPTISLVMASQSVAITTQPGSTGTASTPISYSVSAQVPYEVEVSAPDMTSGSNVLAASNLSDAWGESNQNGAATGSTTLPEGDAYATEYSSGEEASHGGSGGADSLTSTWSVTVPGSQPTGTYSTSIAYLAQANGQA